ncbi:MAG TPA: maleylpyruvate isomerase N-terminal domain-containing protein [Thermoanaerobaculia bacterium]|nr:maleylpyruvate isomerase N-terminal domain-containing protein [Thermoanaerobaculia bacterium]
MSVQIPEPVSTVHLFAPRSGELVALLRGLSPEDWERPTVAGSWRVRDVAAHLLDTDLRRLSMHRDGHVAPPPDPPIQGYSDLVRYINRLNAGWVEMASQRMSPRVITGLLAWTGPQVAEFFASLPPHGRAVIPVAWAGENESENWMDVGREYTEKWHHQEQIRDAVGAPGLTSRRWLFPMLDLSMRALPHAFRGVEAREGTAFAMTITGDAGGVWSLVRGDGRWSLWVGEEAEPAARVRVDAETAWRIFYNALPPEAAAARVEIEGDPRLGAAFLKTRSVMV